MKSKFDLTKLLIIVCSITCLSILAFWLCVITHWTFAVFSVSLRVCTKCGHSVIR